MKAAAAPAAVVRVPDGIDAGALADDRILGLSGPGLADGRSLRVVGVAGALLLLVGALISFSGPTRAIAVPLVLGAAGLAVAIPRPGAVPAVAIAGLLAAGGLLELAAGLTPFGEGAWTAVDLPILLWLGALIAGVGVCLRVVRPTDPAAAYVVLAGTIVFVVGGLLPFGDVADQLPFEMQGLAARGAPLDGSILGLAWDALGAGTLFFALGGVLLLPALALPIATVLAFRRPGGLWDSPGQALRVLGTLIVLWIPLTYAVAAFNLSGWSNDDLPYRQRIQLAVLSAGAVLWVTAGAVALSIRARSTRTG
jgi:hypothetical protein